MSTNTATIQATPEQVWSVLADGWLYPLWVVGATRMRSVDATWPAEGSRLHHSVGVWPLVLDDDTESLECEPGNRLKLKAKGWPLGHAEVTIQLRAGGADTEVGIAEQATGGPGALVPEALQDPLISWRNTETLRRLRYLVEQRTGGTGHS